ncbi:MFS transporter [Edaphobacter sp. 12200R-103]|jgi:ACS family hexuronate transporter-like MFS transporter|nr:MFS transporter [Edaphobacter sp. 12200R-103]
MVAVAIAISYFDRQTLPVAIAAIQRNIPLSNEQFSYLQTAFLLAYAAMYVLGGRLLDALGTRKGFLLIMLWWSLACAMHALATGFMVLLVGRLLLGGGEGGAFPAATRVVAEWIEPNERSTAMGVINAGTAIGSVLAPPIIGFVLIQSGWRAVFVIAGTFGLAWVVWWAISYRSNMMTLSSNTIDARAIGANIGWRHVVSMRRVQVFVFAKFMSDAAWYFLLFWLPKYLYDVRGFDIKQVSYYAWIPYAASGVGSFLGGWLSSRLIRKGRSIDFSRKLVLGLCALGMPVVMLVSVTPVQVALLLFSIAFFCQQAWSGLIMTLPADVFPLTIVGTVAGMIGFGGAIGGAIFGLIAGYMLGHGFTYATLFFFVGIFHLIGFLAILLFAGRIQPLSAIELQRIESAV